jgi:organic radical activating enzyme
MKVCEIFGPVIQGEGYTAGMPVTFLRLSGCNLNCKWCDTKYHKEGENISVRDLSRKLNSTTTKDIVITGGEPMLQKTEMFALMRHLEDYRFHLETNGTIYDERMKNFYNISCSPKKESFLKGIENLFSYDQIARLPQTSFKFVYENGQDKWWETFADLLHLNKDQIFIMPEGATREEQLDKMPEVMDYCSKKGYKFGSRLHVLAYDDKRGV